MVEGVSDAVHAGANSVVTRLHDHGEVLRASGHDPFVRWQLDPTSPPQASPPAPLQAWSCADAVAFVRP
jgi:hypothetical protein